MNLHFRFSETLNFVYRINTHIGSLCPASNLKFMIGNPILELQRVDSTNVYANTLLETSELAEGTVIWAHEQFAGRGQHENHWESEAGKNLTFSIILKPDFLAPERQFLLTKVISLGIADFIQATLSGTPMGQQPLSSGIKWPNDIYINDRKIAGILIENKILGNAIETSVAGVGVNINQTRYASEVPNPVSLVHLLHREMELKASLQVICKSIDHRYQMLRNNNTEALDSAYHNKLIGFMKWRNFICEEMTLEGQIQGVDLLGRLMVKTTTGIIRVFSHKEIEYLF